MLLRIRSCSRKARKSRVCRLTHQGGGHARQHEAGRLVGRQAVGIAGGHWLPVGQPARRRPALLFNADLLRTDRLIRFALLALVPAMSAWRQRSMSDCRDTKKPPRPDRSRRRRLWQDGDNYQNPGRCISIASNAVALREYSGGGRLSARHQSPKIRFSARYGSLSTACSRQ